MFELIHNINALPWYVTSGIYVGLAFFCLFMGMFVLDYIENKGTASSNEDSIFSLGNIDFDDSPTEIAFGITAYSILSLISSLALAAIAGLIWPVSSIGGIIYFVSYFIIIWKKRITEEGNHVSS